MSCCGGNCGCGSDCKCGSNCGGCKMCPDLSCTETTTNFSETLITGVTPRKQSYEGFAVEAGAENGSCKCGSDRRCDHCISN